MQAGGVRSKNYNIASGRCDSKRSRRKTVSYLRRELVGRRNLRVGAVHKRHRHDHALNAEFSSTVLQK